MTEPAPRPSIWRPRVLVRGIVLILTLAALGLLFEGLGLKHLLEQGWIDEHIRGQGLTGEALFIVVGALFTAVGLPRQVVAFLAGYAFGTVIGTGLALLSVLVGAVGAFYYARFMARSFLARKFPEKVTKLDSFLADNTLGMALVLRLAPFTHNLTTNLVAGVSGVRPLPFFAGSALGYLPQTIVFALLGGGIELDPVISTVLSVVLFAVSTVLGLLLWRRYRKDRDEGDVS
ncbi:conserved membrane hypothetical protein [Magnetospirillum sp. LM-5]|uniref:TVP38/TMEM64 family protein n=1 Tax=Magnetospirillum sp. LM-5 TaxID=2681466 RepID=UPI001380E83C|nr:VTT domain-containing protein [Magnetospirillum sp. LM-5]CAA7614756.1 conserved membrane hypothetical protein [Magnetospirillum sp. LM-5]